MALYGTGCRGVRRDTGAIPRRCWERNTRHNRTPYAPWSLVHLSEKCDVVRAQLLQQSEPRFAILETREVVSSHLPWVM